MRVVNLTPHPVVIVDGDDNIVKTFAVDGAPARCVEKRAVIGTIYADDVEIPLAEKAFGEIEGLPDSEPDTVFLVSLPVAQAAKALGRQDVVMPDDLVRDGEGRIVGCRALARA